MRVHTLVAHDCSGVDVMGVFTDANLEMAKTYAGLFQAHLETVELDHQGVIKYCEAETQEIFEELDAPSMAWCSEIAPAPKSGGVP